MLTGIILFFSASGMSSEKIAHFSKGQDPDHKDIHEVYEYNTTNLEDNPDTLSQTYIVR